MQYLHYTQRPVPAKEAAVKETADIKRPAIVKEENIKTEEIAKENENITRQITPAEKKHTVKRRVRVKQIVKKPQIPGPLPFTLVGVIMGKPNSVLLLYKDEVNIIKEKESLLDYRIEKIDLDEVVLVRANNEIHLNFNEDKPIYMPYKAAKGDR